jgi:maleate isomerase
MSTRIGMLVPSSNTAAEPLTMEMLRDVPRVSLHVARFRVTRLDTSDEALAQFQAAPLLEAASMLADAHMHAICLNATASCYTGMAGDRELLPLLPQPAETAMLALLEALRIKGARRIGLVSPFLHDVQAATIRVLAEEGLEVVAEHHFNDPGNYTFARFTEAEIEAAILDVGRTPGLDAIAVISTNLRGPRPAARAEARLGIPVFDTIATALWGAMRKAGADPAQVRGWGSLFSMV